LINDNFFDVTFRNSGAGNCPHWPPLATRLNI